MGILLGLGLGLGSGLGLGLGPRVFLLRAVQVAAASRRDAFGPGAIPPIGNRTNARAKKPDLEQAVAEPLPLTLTLTLTPILTLTLTLTLTTSSTPGMVRICSASPPGMTRRLRPLRSARAATLGRRQAQG